MPPDDELRAKLRAKLRDKRNQRTTGGGGGPSQAEDAKQAAQLKAEEALLSLSAQSPELFAMGQQALKNPREFLHGCRNLSVAESPSVDPGRSGETPSEDEEEAPPPSQ